MKFLMFAGALVFSLSAQAAVWQTQRQWTSADEARYSNWVESSFTRDMFTNPRSRYYNHLTDCADAGYTMRAIYAFENGLPFAVNDPTRRGRAITNAKTTWDRYSDSTQRFIKFMDYLHGILGTSNLNADTYPVKITRDHVVPGGIFLMYRFHTYMFKNIPASGVPVLYSSTVPRQVRTLAEDHGIPAYAFDKSNDPGGIRMFKAPQDITKSEWQLPGFSKEQYDMRRTYADGTSWGRAIHQKLSRSGSGESFEQEMNRYYDLACAQAKSRVDIVNEAVRYRARIGRDMNPAEYDNYSTPSRDGKLLENFNNFIAINNRVRSANSGASSYVTILQNTSRCSVTYDGYNTLSLWEVYSRLSNGEMSTNPNHSVARRWGAY